MIYDCFLFYNEIELLEIRLNELEPFVDKFILVEATVTHTNQPKPLYYQLNKAKFKKFAKKITHIIVRDSPDVSMPWIIERHQLTAVERGLKNCRPDDIILFSCVDEIPKGQSIIEWVDKPGKLKSFNQALSLYFLNYVDKKNVSVHQTRMFRYKHLKEIKDIYLTSYLKPDVIIPNGGWHFSYMGGIKRIQEKLASFAHQELNNKNYNTPEKIEAAIKEGKDPFGMGWKFEIADISFLPKYVQENLASYPDFIISKAKKKKYKLNNLDRFLLILKHNFRIKFLRPLRNYFS